MGNKRLNGPYQVRSVGDGKFVVWSELTNAVIGSQEFYDFEAIELAESMNADYAIDSLESHS
jgi:hypothetical protein